MLAAVLAFTAPAFASDVSVTQKNKTFSTAAMELHVGDTLRFMNEDSVTHNITVKPVGGEDDADSGNSPRPRLERFGSISNF